MKKARGIILLAAAALTVGIALVFRRPQAEPLYNGRPLSYWWHWSRQPGGNPESVANFLPSRPVLLSCLTNQLAVRDGPLEKALTDSRASEDQAAILQDLAEIGPPARSVLPVVVTALQDQNPAVRDAAQTALRRIDPKAAAQEGVP